MYLIYSNTKQIGGCLLEEVRGLESQGEGTKKWQKESLGSEAYVHYLNCDNSFRDA